MKPRNVFALMVGIDKYQSPVPALEGCVNDMRAFADFVELRTTRAGIPLHLNILENQDGTRMNIVEQFDKHLKEAGPEDLMVFYYSGHGSQEQAHSVFWSLEEDRKNETLVCYDSRQPDGMDLADKELATLIDLVTGNGAQMAIVMDCCNSGSATRAIAVEETPANTRVRQTPSHAGARTLDSYILPRDQVGTRGMFSFGNEPNANQLIVPTPRHVAMSATQPFELAKETWLGGSPRGVFTYSLMEVLSNAVGQQSYLDVVRQVRALVRQRTTNQSPQLYAQNTDDINLEFLGGTTAQTLNYYFLNHHMTRGWEIDAGASQGIPAQNASATELAVYDSAASDQDLLDPKKALGAISLKEVRPSSSSVRLKGTLELDKSSAYRTRITEMAVEQLRVHVRGKDLTGVEAARKAISAKGEPDLYIDLEENPSGADYHVVASNNQLVVIRSTDAEDQPLIEQIRGYGEAEVAKLAENLVHIGKWEQILKMNNPGSRLAGSSVRIDLMEVNSDAVIQPGKDGHVFEISPGTSTEQLPQVRVRLTNTSGEKLYASLLYLGSQFQVEPSLLASGGVWLNPGEEAYALNGRAFRMSVNQNHLALGRIELTETLKVIFGTEELNSAPLKQKELTAPRSSSRSVTEETTRSLLFDANMTGANAPGWNTNLATITVRAI